MHTSKKLNDFKGRYQNDALQNLANYLILLHLKSGVRLEARLASGPALADSPDEREERSSRLPYPEQTGKNYRPSQLWC